MTRTLRLRREALTDLSADDLSAIAGGEYRYSNDQLSCGCSDEIDLSPLTRLTLDSRYCYSIPYC